MSMSTIFRTFLCPSLAALAAATTANAQYFEARNSGMGGVGAASSSYLAAGWANPALLTSSESSDTFGMILPAFGARTYDESGLITDLEDFVDSFAAVQSNPAPTVADFTGLANQLQALSGRRANNDIGGGFVLALPSEDFAWSLHARTFADVQFFATIDGADVTSIQNLNPGDPLALANSEARVVGISVSEIGVSFAKRFDLAGFAMSLGVTPKYQRVDTINYAVSAENFDVDDFDEDPYVNDAGEFNLDAGIAIEPGVPGLTVGLMARNLRELEFETVTTAGQSLVYELSPQATLGVAWQLGALTLAADADLLTLERFRDTNVVAAGQAAVDDVQLIKFGAEVDVLGWLQLRGGYEYDVEDTLDGAISAGLGLSPFDVLHIDVAGTYVDDESYGGVVQLSLTF